MPATPQPKPKRRPYNTVLTAEERRLKASHAALTRWARTSDRAAATLAARDAKNARYYAAADEQGVTDPVIRDRMAAAAMRADMTRMRQIRLANARQRRARAAARAADVSAQAGGAA